MLLCVNVSLHMNASIVVLYMHQSFIALNRPTVLAIDSVKTCLRKGSTEEPIEIRNVVYSAFLLNYELSME